MTLKEQKLLVELEKDITDALLTVNPDCITKEILQKHTQEFGELSGEGKIRLMIEQFGNLRIYSKYQCLDVEACRRDVDFLLEVIHHYEDMLKGN